MEGNQEQTTTSPKCKTYILNCSTCRERFTSTKCTDPAEKHTHTQPQKLSSLQGGQIRAKIEGFTTNCWHCDPEAQLDFTSSTSRTPRNDSLVNRTGSMRRKMDRKVDSTLNRAGSIRRRMNQRQSERRTRVKAVARRSWTTTVLRVALVGKTLRRWKNGLSGLSGCFTSRQSIRGEKIPEEEKPPRPASVQTMDAWKLPRMFTPTDS